MKKQPSFDLEALGLVVLALGILIIGLLLPVLPTGAFGAAVRESMMGRIGWAAYLLPWPPLILGGLFLLRQNPKGLGRMLAGYFVVGLGAWALLALLRPNLSGAWGDLFQSQVTGATGALAYLLAILVVSLGLELLLAQPPTSLLRRGARRTALGIQQSFGAFVKARRVAKAKAAFHADVSLVRRDLRNLVKDLTTLDVLYPGSAELKRWRGEVKKAQKRLDKADATRLEEVGLDVRAWQSALGSFVQDRAADLSAQLREEGLYDFDSKLRSVKMQLDEPVEGKLRSARALDTVRKALALDLTAISERYNRLTRERDLAEAHLREVKAGELAAVLEAHGARLARYKEVALSQSALEEDADRLELWRDLMSDVLRVASDYPDAEAVREYDASLTQTLRQGGRGVLPGEEVERQQEELVGLEATLRTPKEVETESGEEVEALEDTPPWEVEAADEAGFETLETGAYEEDEDTEPIPEVGGIPIQIPPYDLLESGEHHQDDPVAQSQEVRSRIAKIDDTLNNFKLQGRVVASVRGPTVTRFEVEPAPGEKISRFANLSDDLALAMAVGSVRIEAPIPGKSVIGLEVPNTSRDLIKFREAAESPSFKRSRQRLPLILGKSIDGEMVIADLVKMPHLLIAGSTGSGKSVAVNTLIGSLVYKFLPTDLRFLMIDPKMVELTPFDGIPHLLRPVVTNPNDAAGVLLGAVAHMERRYKMMSKIGAKTLDQYNQKARNLDLPEMPFIVIVIDELADLMITSPKEVESAIMRLAQMARATGMHLVLATQRPSVDILTSLIKVNVPARVAFAVSSGHDSRTILDTMGAERLTGMGDMLFYQPGLVKPARLQGPFISEEEIVVLSNFLRRQYFEDEFVEAYGSDFDPPPLDDSSATGMVDWNDDKLREAAELVINEGQASVSRLQRRLSVGHARAGKLMDSLEALEVVGPHMGSKPRDVLVDLEELPNLFGK